MASPPPRDPYEVLGVDTSATPEEIKAAYRKLALKYHPDKNQGANAADAAGNFQEVATAYGILSDSETRRKYDQGGFDNLSPSDLQVEVDLTSLGFVNTAVAALFTKLGVPIKTVVAQPVLEAAYNGNFQALPLTFGERQQDEVKKGGAVFYEMSVQQRHIDDGFVIGVHSANGGRFKLLLFEQAEQGKWEPVVQEDSSKSVKGSQVAGLYIFPWQTCSIGPKPSPLETANNPEAVLFQHLETLHPREQIHVRPGHILVGVYGDNWFNKVRFTIQAVHMAASRSSSSAETVQQVEEQLLQKKSEMRQFASRYRQAQAQFEAAKKQFHSEQQQVDELLRQRDDAYLDMLAVHDDPTSVTAAPAHREFPNLTGWGRRKGS